MKNLTKFLTVIGLSIFILTSCKNSGSIKTTEKDLELQKKELDLKQKELELIERQLAMDSIQNANQKTTTVITPRQPTSSTTSSSQSGTTVSLSPLMRDNMTFNLPTTSGRVISLMGNYIKIEYEDWGPDGQGDGWGNRYIWKFSNGLILTAQSNGYGKTPNNSDEVRAIFLEASNINPLDNLVYGLAMNKTTKSECQQLFGSKLKTTIWGTGTYKVYKDNLYTYLTFNSNGTLTKIQQVTFDLENAN